MSNTKAPVFCKGQRLITSYTHEFKCSTQEDTRTTGDHCCSNSELDLTDGDSEDKGVDVKGVKLITDAIRCNLQTINVTFI